jgi:hypothetical protein
LADLTRSATGLRHQSVGKTLSPESSYWQKISLSDERKLYTFEKINEDDCLLLYGA